MLTCKVNVLLPRVAGEPRQISCTYHVTMEEQTTLSQTTESLHTTVPDIDFMLYHTQDGKPLANYIKQRFSDTRLLCSVQTKDFAAACKSNTRKTDSNIAKVTAIIVSPMMLSVLPHLKPVTQDLFPNPELSVALCIQTQMEQVADLMNGTVEQFEKWTTCLIEDDRASFRNCLVMLMTLLEDFDTEPLPTMKLFHVVPSTINSNTEKIHIIFTKEIHGQVEVRYCDEVMATVVYNPYTVVFSPPVQPPSSGLIEITINGVSMGTDTVLFLSKKEEMFQLLHDVINPLEFLSETVFSEQVCGEEDVDGKLADTLEEDINVKLIDAFRQVQYEQWDDCPTRQEQPTLLHLAAKLGLQKLATVVLKMPGAIHACCMLNSAGWSAEDIARMSGHSQLADDIQKFKQHHKNRNKHTGKETTYVDMKKTLHGTRTESAPVSPVSPPIPTTPRPKTDPKLFHSTSANNMPSPDCSLDNVDEETPILRRQECKARFSGCRDWTVLESKHKLSLTEKNKSARVTLLMDDLLDGTAPSAQAQDKTTDRIEREYATIGEIFEDLKPYLSISGHKQTTCPPIIEHPSLTRVFKSRETTAEPYSVCKPEENIYNIPKPISQRK